MQHQSEPTKGGSMIMRVLVVVFIVWVAFWAATSIDTIVVASDIESLTARIA